MINLGEITTLAFVMLVGSISFSTLGFGNGITTLPFLLLFLDPKTAVILVNTGSFMLCTLIILDSKSHLNIKKSVGIGVCGMLGVPLGIFILAHVNISALRISITLFILALTISIRFKFPISLIHSRLTGYVVGFTVGTLTTFMGVGGPLIAILFLKREWNRKTTRVSLAFYFLLLHLATVPAYLITGMYTQERVSLILIGTIPILIGYKSGTMLIKKMSETRFRQAMVTVIILTSLFVLGREVINI